MSNVNDQMNAVQGFEGFGLSPEVLMGVKDAGFVSPSPVQVKAIPEILAGRDVLAQAHTGTGKTAAFGLPLMSKLKPGEQMLVMTPTRELAMQVSEELFRLGKHAGIRTMAIYGGQSYARQRALISEGVQVIVATPGRLLDLLSGSNSNKITISPKYVVLDEADEMLDMGFFEDINKILDYLPKKRQTLLFSATISKMIQKLAGSFLREDAIRLNTKETNVATNNDIDELYFVIEEYERDDALIRVVDYYDPVKAIIFTRTKKDADRVSTMLIARGLPAKGLHGDLSQPQREEVIRSFRQGSISLLVATDVAARGLDIADVSHVLNFHLPFDPDSYVHRVGRTGRAGNKGMAITLVTPQEYKGLTRIQKITGADIAYRKVPTLSEAHKNLVATLVKKVRNVDDISHLASPFVEELEKEFAEEEIIIRLASLMVASESFTGPEHLGVYGKKLEKLQTGGGEREYRSNRSGSGKGGDRRRSGGSGDGGDSRPYRIRKKYPKEGGSGSKYGGSGSSSKYAKKAPYKK
ncbi:MAG: DEAD/DEAH box helicase [Deferribacteraceae bacterium]|jgi:ATP-dependent RNA helicase DeaD|nr:DEAD/DEAH box helicase [Deferribacteraceae bacterium]